MNVLRSKLKTLFQPEILICFCIFILIIGVVIFYFHQPSGRVAPSAYLHNCKNKLRTLGQHLHLYKNQTGEFPPIDGGKYSDNWADYLRRGENNWNRHMSDLLFICPYRKEFLNTSEVKNNHYFFANSQDKDCFPDGRFSEHLAPKTPIAGDAYDTDEQVGNHGPIQSNEVHVLLFDGSVRSVDPRNDKLEKKAYNKCLNGTFDASLIE